LVERRRAWLLVGFLWVAFFFNYCDRQLVSAIFPLLRLDLGFTNLQLGLTGSLFLWMYGISSPFAGQIADRRSARWLALGSLGLWSVVTFLTGAATSANMLLAGRVLMGLTEAAFVPPAMALLASAHAPVMQSRATSFFYTAQLAGAVAGGALGGWIAEQLGWRLAFFIMGAAGLLFVVPFLCFLRGFPEPANAPLQTGQPRVVAAVLVRVPSFVSLCICFPAFTVVLWVLYTWLPDFLYGKFKIGLAQAGFVATAYLQVATLVGLILGGAFSDWLYRRTEAARFWVIAGAILFGSPWVHLIGHSSSLAMAELGAAGFGLGLGAFMANLMIAPFGVVPNSARASAVAIMNTVGPPFSGLAALFGGVWKDSLGIPNLMSVVALISLISGLALLVATRRYFGRDHARQQASAA
jgi:predicted MFS family arabinose efflux permease